MKLKNNFMERDSDAIGKYLSEIKNYEVLPPEEEYKIFQKLKNSNNPEEKKRIKESLIKANLKFVVSVAKQYQGRGLELIDLISEGNIGLIKAIDRFDETKGYKFISYAVHWIKQRIIEALSESNTIHVPANISYLQKKINLDRSKLEQKKGDELSDDEITILLNLKREEVEALVQAKKVKTISLFDSTNQNEGGLPKIETVADLSISSPDKKIIEEGLKKEVNNLLNTLPERDREIIKYYYGIGREKRSSEEISEILKLSKERIRQLHERAIRRLKIKSKTLEVLKEYL